MPQEKDVTAQESAQRSGNVGAVMVVGGGVAGIQAALDMANSGFYVHLVETKPAIGGVMAQLDKTFPTNDCSMCIISPKLVECGRHLNIEIHHPHRVAGIEGEPGNLSVTLKKQPPLRRSGQVHRAAASAPRYARRRCPMNSTRAWGPERRPTSLSPGGAPEIRHRQGQLHLFQEGRQSCKACEKFCPPGPSTFPRPTRNRRLRSGP